MKASELIKELQKLIDQGDDLTVMCEYGAEIFNTEEVRVETWNDTDRVISIGPRYSL